VTISERDWELLAADQHASGTTSRRIYPHSPYDMFIAVRHPGGCRMVTLQVPRQDADAAVRRIRTLPCTRGIEMQLQPGGHAVGELRVVLTDPSLRDVFNPLVDDIACAVQQAATPPDAVLAAVSRFEHWRRMMEKLAETGLAPESRRGLFGELEILRSVLIPVMHPAGAVSAWTGPLAAHQDFQLPSAAIEVKTSSGKEPQRIVIASERELDAPGVPVLILAHLSLDERRGGTGESLNTAIDRTRQLLGSADAVTLMDSLLARAGYLSHQRHLYDEPRYTIRGQSFWHVTGDFPRITEADLRPGVGDCRYHITAAGHDQYVMTGQQVAAAITAGIP
jgi:hypothetical protein